MQKIGSITTTADVNGEWTNGNVAGGIAPTILDAAWLNTVQRELAGVVTGSGLTLDPTNDLQVLAALKKLFLQTGNNFSEIKTAGTTAVAAALANLGLGGYRQDTGTANNIIITAPGISTLAGVPFYIRVAATNTGSVTINCNGLGAAALWGNAGVLQGGELQSGCLIFVSYDASNNAYFLIGQRSTGGFQIGKATSSAHAVRLDQFQAFSNGNGAAIVFPNTSQYARGNLTIGANAGATWTFPLAFAASPQTFYTTLTPANAIQSAMWINSISPSQCSLYNPNSYSCTVNMFAIL